MTSLLWKLAVHAQSRLAHLSPVLRSLLLSGGGRGDAGVLRAARLFQLAACSSLPATTLDALFGVRDLPVTDLPVVQILPVGGSEAGGPLIMELLLLAGLVRRIAPKTILEIGTYMGRGTWHLFHNAPNDAVIYTIDLPDGELPGGITDSEMARNKGRRFVPCSDRVRQILVDMRKWDAVLERPVQFAFIDASHSYSDVKNDTDKVRRVLDEDACICWHDSLWRDDGYGVYRYLEEARSRGMDIFRVQEPLELSSIAIWLSPKCMQRTGLRPR